jgi:2-keto-3-deoxy-L-rhamnonate aldolase RhmA
MRLRQNALKQTLRSGGVALSTSLNEACDAGSIHAIAAGGADTVFIDLQHSPFDKQTVVNLAAHAHASGLTPLVRPPRIDEAWITMLIDSGCQSLMFANLRGPDDVEELVELSRRRPLGRRATLPVMGPNVRDVRDADIDEATAWANEQLVLGLVIETPEAIDAMDKMLTPGVDFAVLGSYDLSYSLGVKRNDPLIVQAEERLRSLCLERGVAYGVFQPRLDQLPDLVANGARFINYGGVFAYIRSGVDAAAKVVNALRADEDAKASEVR